MSSQLFKNIVANFAGRVWGALLGVLLVPIYIGFLGVESYGLFGLYLLLQAIAGILDAGINQTVCREIARISAYENSQVELAKTYKTFETIYLTIAFLIFCVIYVLSGWVATNWLKAGSLEFKEITSSVELMAFIVAFQFLASIYQGALNGLQEQVKLNTILAFGATVRGLGAVLVLWLIGSAIELFFLWHVLSQALLVLVLRFYVKKDLDVTKFLPIFSFSVLQKNFRFMTGISVNAIVGIITTQADKILISSLLSLEVFGIYTIAATISTMLLTISMPVMAAFYPRMVQAYSESGYPAANRIYSESSRLMSLVILPVVVLVAIFPREILYVWIGDQSIAEQGASLVLLLGVASGINGIVASSFTMQYAVGKTHYLVFTNAAFALLAFPVGYLMIERYGLIGAGFVWMLANVAYFLITVPIMHHFLPLCPWRKIYWVNFIFPALFLLPVATMLRLVGPDILGGNTSRLVGFGLLALYWVLLTGVCAMSISELRRMLLLNWR